MDPVSVQVPAQEASIVQSRLAGGALPGMIDVHTHFMPDQVMNKVWAYFDAAGPMIGREWPITYRAQIAERLETLRSFGVRRFTALSYPHKPDMAQWLNDWSADFAAVTPDCLHSATFFPEPGAPAYVTAAIERGARIFKAHVQVGDYDPNDPLLDQVWGVLEDAGIPVVIHAGSGPAPGRFTGPERIEAVLSRYPRLTLVIAHMGMPEYAQFLGLCESYDRVYLDTTMAFTPFIEAQHPFPEQLRDRLAQAGERVLFGSDFPNIPYPYLTAVDAVLGLDLGADWSRKVLWDNAAELFQIVSRRSRGR